MFSEPLSTSKRILKLRHQHLMKDLLSQLLNSKTWVLSMESHEVRIHISACGDSCIQKEPFLRSKFPACY